MDTEQGKVYLVFNLGGNLPPALPYPPQKSFQEKIRHRFLVPGEKGNMTYNRFRQFHFCLLFLKAYMLFKNNQLEPIYVQCIYCTYVQRKPETGLYNRNLTALKAWHNYCYKRESQKDFICHIYFLHVNILKQNKNKLLMHRA